jgi:hypothetical protein
MGTDARLIEGWNGEDYERHSSHQQPCGTHFEQFRRMNVWARRAG